MNWNNKPARDFPASDERWDEGGIQRNQLLLTELARTERHTPASVLGAANAASTRDPRGLMWPVVERVLRQIDAPGELADAVVTEISGWSAAGASWVDANGDGAIDAPGQAAMEAVWDQLAGAAMCGRLGRRVCAALETRQVRFQRPPSGMYGGWHQYVDKDLRTLLGRRVAGRYNLRYCGRGEVTACAEALWTAIDHAAQAEARRQGTEVVSQWHRPVVRVDFPPVGLAPIQWTNRPSGIHQVMQFAP